MPGVISLIAPRVIVAVPAFPKSGGSDGDGIHVLAEGDGVGDQRVDRDRATALVIGDAGQGRWGAIDRESGVVEDGGGGIQVVAREHP